MGEAESWFIINGPQLELPAIALTEIEQGISRLRRLGGHERADRLSRWIDKMLDIFADRVVPIDAAIAMRAGSLSDEMRARGLNPGVPDILIAATALVRDLPVATRNLRHFEQLGVACFDPFGEIG